MGALTKGPTADADKNGSKHHRALICVVGVIIIIQAVERQGSPEITGTAATLRTASRGQRSNWVRDP